MKNRKIKIWIVVLLQVALIALIIVLSQSCRSGKSRTVTFDTTIKSKNIVFDDSLKLKIDALRLQNIEDSAKDANKHIKKEESRLDSAGDHDCDTIIKYVEKENGAKDKIIYLYKQAKCEAKSKTLDTLGMHIDVSSYDGILNVKVKTDSIKIHEEKKTAPCPKQKKTWFWEFVCACIAAFLLLVILIKR